MFAITLDAAVRAVCPISGVSIGNPNDKTTWRIDFAAGATDQQKAAALAAVQAFNPNAPDVPDIISDRQFYQQMAIQGIITQAEAIAAVGPGTLPATLASLISQLPAGAQFDAKMKAIGAVQFSRSSSLVATIAQLFGWDGPTTDTFWVAASQLL
jgi:hypothetical protein